MKKLLMIMVAFVSILMITGCSQTAKPSDEDVIGKYQSAAEANSWFRIASLPTDPATATEYNGIPDYCKVKKFKSMSAFRKYLATLFSEPVIQSMLESSDYVEIDGALYTRDGARGTDISKGEETYAVVRESDKKMIVKVTVQVLDPDSDFKVIGDETYEFPYESIDGKWVFTEFTSIR